MRRYCRYGIRSLVGFGDLFEKERDVMMID